MLKQGWIIALVMVGFAGVSVEAVELNAGFFVKHGASTMIVSLRSILIPKT